MTIITDTGSYTVNLIRGVKGDTGPQNQLVLKVKRVLVFLILLTMAMEQ